MYTHNLILIIYIYIYTECKQNLKARIHIGTHHTYVNEFVTCGIILIYSQTNAVVFLIA